MHLSALQQRPAARLFGSPPGVWISCLAVLLAPAGLKAQTSFVESAAVSGLVDTFEMPVSGFGTGATAADFDGDGWVDLFFVNDSGLPHLLYRNLGDGTFEEIAGDVGLGVLERARAAVFFDADGDGRQDLLTHRDCFDIDCAGITSFLRLYQQGPDGQFSDVTESAGLLETGATSDQHRSGLAVADLNGDSFLDFVTGFWMGELSVYLNGGDGTFMEVSAISGVDDAILGYHQPVLHDVDADGDIDIYASVDFSENRLWINEGTSESGVPTFLELGGEAGCDNAMNDMGVAVGDYDDDGDLDFYVSNIFRKGFHNVLLRSHVADGNLSFSEVSEPAGVKDGAWGWGTSFFDLDNDGDLDLAETNGWHTSTWIDPPRLFVHQGTHPPTFVDQAAAAGLTDPSWGSSLLAFDYDLDGDVDMVELIAKKAGGSGRNEMRLHRNELIHLEKGSGGSPHYLLIRPRQSGANARAIGARVEVITAEHTMTRWISAGSSYLGQEPAEAFFGLAGASRADVVTVSWPDGRRTQLSDVAANQTLTVSSSSLFSNGFENGGFSAWSAAVP